MGGGKDDEISLEPTISLPKTSDKAGHQTRIVEHDNPIYYEYETNENYANINEAGNDNDAGTLDHIYEIDIPSDQDEPIYEMTC